MNPNQFAVSKTVDYTKDGARESFFLENKGDILVAFITREDLTSLKYMIEAAIRINEEEVENGK